MRWAFLGFAGGYAVGFLFMVWVVFHLHTERDLRALKCGLNLSVVDLVGCINGGQL